MREVEAPRPRELPVDARPRTVFTDPLGNDAVAAWVVAGRPRERRASRLPVAVGTAVAWQVNGWSAPAAEWLGQPEGSSVGAVVPSVLVACVALVGVSLVTRPKATAG